MSKLRILGGVILFFSIIARFVFEDSGYDFLYGTATGAGITLMLIGKTKKA